VCMQEAHVMASSQVPQRVRDILSGVIARNRAKLAEAITLVESKHPTKHRQAQWLLAEVLSRRRRHLLGQLRPPFRLGVSGPPGAGKSSFIERLGQLLTGRGLWVAVLAVDPSSVRTGGSILADKTRMPRLSRDPLAYIRPSPSGGSLGGVTRSTNEAITLCEGAGYDVVVVETVGVGQSETEVSKMTDMFLLLLPPAAGDELQGMKRGIMELADLVVVNKADGDLLPAARRLAADYTSALKLLNTSRKNKLWKPSVLMASAVENTGIQETWDTVELFRTTMESAGELDKVRRTQRKGWMWSHVDYQLVARFRDWPGMAALAASVEEKVAEGAMAPGTATDLLLDHFFDSTHKQ
jgi:LAO/AO transport system kinase